MSESLIAVLTRAVSLRRCDLGIAKAVSRDRQKICQRIIMHLKSDRRIVFGMNALYR